MQQSRPYRAGIVGLGKIGFSLDLHLPQKEYILSHAKALFEHSRFFVTAGIDPVEQNRKSFDQAYGVPTFSSIFEWKNNLEETLDLIVLSVPTTEHFETFKECLALRPRMILLEKPLSLNFSEASTMVRMAEEAGVLLAVNYIRRFEPGVLELKSRLQSGEIGRVQKVFVRYSKGLFNNASHFIDLCQFLFPELDANKLVVHHFQSRPSIVSGDMDVDFSIQSNGLTFYFISLDENFYSIRDLEIYGEKGALYYESGGEEVSIRGVEESGLFKGYRFLSSKSEKISSDLKRYQLHVAEAICQALDRGVAPASNGESALKTMAIVEKVRALCPSV